ncbi:hypothetical protein SAMN06295905_0798 [Devosia lucknowensis]|uniref:DUF6894 domain-containing protein n=1 Tax=Devosia lucknowensis TaxID=1096929 RepID=A0A1Y6EL80_9HYPH|nr:hypothetical protein [Devosia lucknowensis]SMQ63337.1 hypothetical protein SAMN06295905_0798 [Devosia lucknowensis]
MPLFYFDVRDGERLAPDNTGTDLPNASVAREEAARTLSEIAAEEIPRDGPDREFCIIVRDAVGTELFELCLTFHARSF